jgi:threonine-phosphate decarboxylase
MLLLSWLAAPYTGSGLYQRIPEMDQGRRDYLFYQLNQIDGLMVYPSKANFYLAKICKEIIDAWTLKELMLRKGFLIRTPDGFSFFNSLSFRLAVKDRKSNEQVVTALQEILSLFFLCKQQAF